MTDSLYYKISKAVFYLVRLIAQLFMKKSPLSVEDAMGVWGHAPPPKKILKN
jgi:hypothetical protein